MRYLVSSARNQATFAARAIDASARDHAEQIKRIDVGIADLDAGRSIGHGRMAAWLCSWGKKGEKPAPR